MYQLVVLVLVSTAYAQLEVDGPCNLTSVARDRSSFTSATTGTWYQLARIPNSVDSGECAHSLVRISTILTNDDNVTIVTTGSKYDVEVASGKRSFRNGTISNMTILSDGVLEVSYEDIGTQTYLLLGTDDTEYLVLYSCRNSGSKSLVTAWKYGRNTTYSGTAINKTTELITNANLGNATWKTVLHTEAACRSGAQGNFTPIAILIFISLVLFKEV